jgi:serine/threonine-protein kinase
MVGDRFGIVGVTLAGTFRVEEAIAEGGFAVVYRAEHVAFRAPVALKCLKIPGTIAPADNDSFVESFREEAEILFHLSAQIPEVVRPLHADAMTLDDGRFVPYLVLEWVEGTPLDAVVISREDKGKPPLGIKQVTRMLTPIARALHRAHRFRVPGGSTVCVAHCDLKPENVLITAPGSSVAAKILDFGIASAREAVAQAVGRITESSQPRPFTPGYGAPEQWAPKRFGQAGPWTDVWGLAITMVECLVGHPVIMGDPRAMMGTVIDPGRRPTPRSEGALVSDAVERAFARALAVDPCDRYQNVAAFWGDLETAQGLEPSIAVAEVAVESDDAPPSSWPTAAPAIDTTSQPASWPVAPAWTDAAKPRAFTMPSSLEGNLPVVGPIAMEQRLREMSSSGAGAMIDLSTSSAPPPLRAVGLPSTGPPGATDPTPSIPLAASVPGAKVATAPMPAPRPAVVATPRPLPAAPLPAGRPGPAPQARRAPPPEGLIPPGLRERLRWPVVLVALAIGLSLAEMITSSYLGFALALGPLRSRWIAAALAATGILMAFWNLVSDRDDRDG